MDDIIERFFQVKRAKGIADKTEVSYRETLRQFLGHYLAADPTRTLQDVRSDDILEAGGDVETLQTLLGHAEITPTLRYVMYDREKRALVAQRKYAPFAATVG